MIKIPYSKQNIDEDDIKAVIETLNSQFLTTGPKVEEFENSVREITQIHYNVACSSGTSALHLALMSIGVGPGDEVIVPSISFVATANAVEYCGARCVFCDIDKALLIDIDDIKKKITKKTIAIIGVDMSGQSIDYSKLRKEVGTAMYIIADSAHNFLGHNQNTSKDIDLICYSFHPVKLITTGEGGMVSTNNFVLYNRIKCMRNHGRSNGDMVLMGYNYRMDDIRATIGISQLKKAQDFIYERIEIAERYLSHEKINKIALKRSGFHTNHLFIIKVKNRNYVIDYLSRNGITTQIHYKPIYENEWYYKKYGKIILKNTEEVKDNILSIPIYPGLSNIDQDKIIKDLLKVI